jgi:hypothetical protein
MKSKNTIEDEIDVIRDTICERINGMTPAEEISYFRKQTDEVCREFGITFCRVSEQEKEPELIANK